MSSASGSANPEFPVEAKMGFRPDGGYSVDEWIKMAGRLTFEDFIARNPVLAERGIGLIPGDFAGAAAADRPGSPR